MQFELNVFFEMLFKTFGAIFSGHFLCFIGRNQLLLEAYRKQLSRDVDYKEHVTWDTNKQMTSSRTISSKSRADLLSKLKHATRHFAVRCKTLCWRPLKRISIESRCSFLNLCHMMPYISLTNFVISKTGVPKKFKL